MNMILIVSNWGTMQGPLVILNSKVDVCVCVCVCVCVPMGERQRWLHLCMFVILSSTNLFRFISLNWQWQVLRL